MAGKPSVLDAIGLVDSGRLLRISTIESANCDRVFVCSGRDPCFYIGLCLTVSRHLDREVSSAEFIGQVHVDHDGRWVA
jgi:hypothetical protein